MDSKYLGDAFDHWKGSIIQRLEEKGLLENIAVDPMINNSNPWDSKNVSAYSKLLNLKSKRAVLHQNKRFEGDREEYFKSIRHRGDLFLDPDTGVSQSNHDRKHITLDEIKIPLDNNRGRVILVYQHRDRRHLCEQLENVIAALGGKRALHLTTYDCGHVAMLFFSYSRSRISKIEKYLKKMLSDDTGNRVIIWSPS